MNTLRCLATACIAALFQVQAQQTFLNDTGVKSNAFPNMKVTVDG